MVLAVVANWAHISLFIGGAIVLTTPLALSARGSTKGGATVRIYSAPDFGRFALLPR